MKKILLLLLFGALLISCSGAHVKVVNPIKLDRQNETVEVAWSDIVAALPEVTPDRVVVFNPNGDEQPSQVIYNGTDTAQSLIFQASVGAKGSATYTIREGERADYPVQAYGRFVPERMDDFAWENNRIAHRIYGPALEASGEISNGIDVWLKRTDSMVIDHWYDLWSKGQDYHSDRGQGLDNYKVGRTLGAGAMAPYEKDSLWLGHNFTSYRVLDNGPLRVSFELEYAPFRVDTVMVGERRSISLDANTSFSRVTELFTAPVPNMKVAAGVVLRGPGAVVLDFLDKPIKKVGYWEKPIGDDGITGLGIIFPVEMKVETRLGHLLSSTTIPTGVPFTYLVGAGWSKGGFPTSAEWTTEISTETQKFHNPLVVTVK